MWYAAKLREAATYVIAMSVLVLNLHKIKRTFAGFAALLEIWVSQRKLVLAQ